MKYLFIQIFLTVSIGAIVAAWAAFQITQQTKADKPKEVQKVKSYKWEIVSDRTEGFVLAFGINKGALKGEIEIGFVFGSFAFGLERKAVAKC